MDTTIYNSELVGVAKIGPYVIGQDIDAVVCINLVTRPDRRDYMIATCKTIPFRFFFAQPHTNPGAGCCESHLACIQWAKDNNLKNILILEDDIVIVGNLADFPEFPEDWAFIYLGGLCTHIHSWENVYPGSKKYIKGCYYCCHAYIVNAKAYDKMLGDCPRHEASDRYLGGVLHWDAVNYPAYALYEPVIIQKEDYSDLDQKNKWVGFNWPKTGERFNIP